jgi:hypothetical protein
MDKPVTIKQYLEENTSIVMIILTIDTKEYQYNFWNIVGDALYFLKDDYTIGHIIYNRDIEKQKDGSFVLNSNNHPKNIKLNFYFGGVVN